MIQTIPAINAGMIGLNSWAVLTSSAAAARAVGPPQGVRFMVPAPSATMPASTIRLMPNLLYSGNNAGMVIKKVDAPEPSKWAIIAMTTVPMVIFTGSPLTSFKILVINGSNSPALFITPKNKIANPNIMPVGATLTIPSNIKVPNSLPKPPINAKTIGTKISETITDTFLVNIRTKNTAIVKNPNKANKFTLPVKITFFLIHSP